MCVISLTLEALSATSGEHGMLHPTQSVLLDPIHNKDALVSFFSTLKPLTPNPFQFFCHFFLFHHELSSSFHAQESFLLTLFFVFANATFSATVFSHSFSFSFASINMCIFVLLFPLLLMVTELDCFTYITTKREHLHLHLQEPEQVL